MLAVLLDRSSSVIIVVKIGLLLLPHLCINSSSHGGDFCERASLLRFQSILNLRPSNDQHRAGK